MRLFVCLPRMFQKTWELRLEYVLCEQAKSWSGARWSRLFSKFDLRWRNHLDVMMFVESC